MIVFLIKQGLHNPELITGFTSKIQAVQFLTVSKGCLNLADKYPKVQEDMLEDKEYYLLPHFYAGLMFFNYCELFFIEEFKIQDLENDYE